MLKKKGKNCFNNNNNLYMYAFTCATCFCILHVLVQQQTSEHSVTVVYGVYGGTGASPCHVAMVN